MSLATRLPLYRELEQRRRRPLLVYVTSVRQGQGLAAGGIMAADVIGEFLQQLEALPDRTTAVDLLIVSHGGDPTVAWRIVSLIRERVKRFAVLVPEAAFSAATLVALGADEIVMHPHGNLGPVDPQIPTARKDASTGAMPPSFGSEDLAAFITYAREEVGLTDQEELFQAFKLFCGDVSAVQIGVAARSAQLTVSLGEKLLRTHMKGDEAQSARAISEALSKSFFHHGYPLNRTEAKAIGLKVTKPSKEVEDLLWRVWLDLTEELQVREPFSPLNVLAQDPATAPLFAPVPQISIPANLPPQVAQQVLQGVLQQIQVEPVPPVPYSLIHAVLESPRLATRFVSDGRVFGVRTPDLQVRSNVVPERASWRTMPIEGNGGGAE